MQGSTKRAERAHSWPAGGPRQPAPLPMVGKSKFQLARLCRWVTGPGDPCAALLHRRSTQNVGTLFLGASATWCIGLPFGPVRQSRPARKLPGLVATVLQQLWQVGVLQSVSFSGHCLRCFTACPDPAASVLQNLVTRPDRRRCFLGASRPHGVHTNMTCC